MPSSLARYGSSVVVFMALGLVLFERARLSSHTALAPPQRNEVHASAARPSSLPAVEVPQPASLPLPPPAADEPLAVLPLPNCSVFFFHHLEKTGGTTLRSVMQRAAQLGELDFISFVNRFDKLQFQAVLHRLWTLLRTPGGLTSLRLGIEIHIGGHRDHAFFLKYTVPDLLLLRSALRAAGCRCNLVTLLRHPLLQHLSWHYHFVNHRVPLCFWSNPTDCQARLAMGLTCHDGPNLAMLTPSHHAAVDHLWQLFDLVGVTELFDEFMLLLAELVGLRRPAYRMQTVSEHTLAHQQAQRQWTASTCAQLVAAPPEALRDLMAKRMAGSRENAARHRARMGRSSSRGALGTIGEGGNLGKLALTPDPNRDQAHRARWSAAATDRVRYRG